MYSSACAGLVFWLAMICATAGEPLPDADRWLTNAGARPAEFIRALADTNHFGTLRAEVVAGTLQVKCEAVKTMTQPRLIVSADAPGHWPARDWRTVAMRSAGPNWLAEIPVDSLDVPQIYFVAAGEGEGFVVSPMRLALPRALGLERPTRLFWAFLEGFEQDLDSWRGAEENVHTDALARSGRAALVLRVPVAQRSASVQTTRLRGWFVQEHGADGVGLWLRTRTGTGRVAFTLAGNALSTNQFLSRRKETVIVSTNWSRARLTFDSFPKAPLADLDLFRIDFAADSGTELLIDDLHLLGRWPENF